MNRKAVVFGTGGFAEVAHFYLTKDGGFEVAGFSASGEAAAPGKFMGLPLVDFAEVQERFPPEQYEMFIAVGYAQLNQVRARFCQEAKAKGYRLLSYVCSKATTWDDLNIGENVFVFEDNTIQPFVTIGDNTILWSGNHIGHHSTIGSHCFITSHVVVSGYCRVGDYTFIGVNATISDDTAVAERNFIGPGTLIQKSTKPGEAYIGERSKKYPKGSEVFFQ